MQIQSLNKVHLNTISNGELSDPLCNRVNRGLTLVRLQKYVNKILKSSSPEPLGQCQPICHKAFFS